MYLPIFSILQLRNSGVCLIINFQSFLRSKLLTAPQLSRTMLPLAATMLLNIRVLQRQWLKTTTHIRLYTQTNIHPYVNMDMMSAEVCVCCSNVTTIQSIQIYHIINKRDPKKITQAKRSQNYVLKKKNLLKKYSANDYT